MAYDNSDRLNLLINNLLDMEKFAAGMMDAQMHPIDLTSLVNEAVEATTGYGHEYGITFTYSDTNEPLMVNADKDRLMQVMANLLSNAAKFSGRGGGVEISTARYDENIRIAVKDLGCGIPKAARPTIFSRFTQADSSDQRAKGGTGLGLSITKAIIEEHGGSIGFDSEEGKGTTFYIDLPIWREESQVEKPTDEKPADEPDPDKPQMLIIEDKKS